MHGFLGRLLTPVGALATPQADVTGCSPQWAALLPIPQAASCHWVRPPETVAGIFLRRFDRSPCQGTLSSPYSLILSPCALDCSCLSDCTLCFQVVRRKPHAAGYPSRRKPHAAGYPSRRKPHARPRWLLTLCSLSLSLFLSSVDCPVDCSRFALALLAHLA